MAQFSMSLSIQQMKSYHRVTAIEVGEMRALFRMKKSIKRIAEMLKRSRATVKRAIGLSVLPPPLRTRALTRAVSRRRDAVYKLADTVRSEMVSWKVYEGQKREKLKRRLYQFTVFPTARSISIELRKININATPWTVHRDLQAGGFLWRKRRHVVSMDPDLWPARLSFCQSTLLILKRLRLAFADECAISMAVDSTMVFHYRRTGQPPLPRQVGRASGKAEKCHIWAMIAPGFRKIIMFSENVSAAVYCEECLTSVMQFVKSQRLTLVHDNAGAHAGHHCHTWAEEKKFPILQNFPPYSPDLNVLEQLWPHLKRAVSARHPTIRNFRQVVEEEFHKIPQAVIDKILGGFKKKLETCVERQGRHFDV